MPLITIQVPQKFISCLDFNQLSRSEVDLPGLDLPLLQIGAGLKTLLASVFTSSVFTRHF